MKFPSLPPGFTKEQFSKTPKDEIAQKCADEWFRIANKREAEGYAGGSVEWPRIYAREWLQWKATRTF